MGVRLGFSYWEMDMGWGCLRIRCWGEHLGLGGTRWQGSGEDYITSSSMLVYTSHQILFGWSNPVWDGLGMLNVWRKEKCIQGFSEEKWRRRTLRRPSGDWRIILKWIFKKWDGEIWSGLIWLRTRTSCGRLWTGEWTFGLHKMRGIFWLAEGLLASQEGRGPMEWVIWLAS